MSSSISLCIEDFPLNVRVGFYAHEKDAPQRIYLSIDGTWRPPHLMSAPELEPDRDYDAVVGTIKKLADGPHVELLESFLEALSTQLRTNHPFESLTLTVEKPSVLKGEGRLKVRHHWSAQRI